MTDPTDVGRRAVLAAGASAISIAGCLDRTADEPAADDRFVLEEVADGLDHPWGIDFLPDGDLAVVTERGGRLLLVDTEEGDVAPVDGAPEVAAAGQGGLLDPAVDPPWLYLTYSVANDDGETATAVGRGRLDAGEARLESFERLHVAEPFYDSDGHYGSRVVLDDAVYVTTGDRQFKEFGPGHVSQDRGDENGATLRLEPDGSIPADNPFLDDPEAADAIYSYGHRNAQGMTVHPETGELWQSEHGEQDGDELNVIEAGGNYGWPITHTGCTYDTGEPVGEEPFDRADVVDPIYYWECGSGGFPPAGMSFYDGEAFPDWRGDLFVGTLAGEYLGRFSVDGRAVTEREPLLSGRGWRIRDVAVAPETGHLYVAVDDRDVPLVRLVPE